MTPINWQLIICGINHKSSSLKQREPLQIGRDEIAEATTSLSEIPGVFETVIISTCNRIEFYLVAKKIDEPFEFIKSFYKNYRNLDISNLRQNFYIRKNSHTVAHLFKVNAGIDSMVLGENQILGQIKDAYSFACAVRTTGKITHRLFHQAFRVGKLIRAETEMGKGACSISSAAVEFLKARIEKIESPSILFVGVNQMISLAASKLAKLKHNKFVFANRTLETAREFAARFGGSSHSLDDLQSILESADLIITCTGSKESVITRDMIDKFIDVKPRRKLTIMDMAVPRDVEIENDYNPDISIYDLEDIKQHVKERQQKRELAIPQAQEIIDRKLSEFEYWFDHAKHEPIYNGLNETYENIRRQEVMKLIEVLPSDYHDKINQATRKLVKRLIQVKMKN